MVCTLRDAAQIDLSIPLPPVITDKVQVFKGLGYIHSPWNAQSSGWYLTKGSASRERSLRKDQIKKIQCGPYHPRFSQLIVISRMIGHEVPIRS
ncbi:hypothetical protein BDV39DRAFT_179210 [Aspergillus sergii]|uniref:Uncharacterized protein n=1 Tax=Aspergillus sergii TaxID=1034303 RepID=A0A5N6WWG5_9EURO|nr:hypothetical protein BDV39DRAFT_179210 [Aspergillus sergii]